MPGRHTRSRRPRQIDRMPLDSAAPRVRRDARRSGVVEGGRTTKVTRQRRARATWAIVVLAVLAIVLVIGAAWLWVGGRSWSVQRGLAGGLGSDRLLRSVTREPVPDTGGFALAVGVTQGGKLESAALLSVDPSSRRAWIMSVPADASVPLESGVVRLGQAYAEKGPAPVVAALESVLSTEVAGYVEIDAARAGEIASAPTTASASAPIEVRMRTLMLPVMRAIGETKDRYGMLAFGRAARGILRTDLSLAELGRLAEALAVVPDSRFASAEMPTMGRGGVAVPDATAARQRASALAAGKAQRVSKAREIPPSSISVTVHNGVGVAGLGADCASKLRAAGYKIKDVGNAAQFIYPETLVIHKSNAAAAKQVAEDLPVGRVVDARGMYAFDSTVLVVIGKDWPRPR